MKLSPLLSEFLLSNKQLNLAGIGRFLLDDAGAINFEQDHSVREDSNLVNYIAEKTGKMKSLVASDLDSHLELAKQFLNIGKPYLFEGIGTLAKNKFSKYEFTPVNISVEKNESPIEGRDITSTTESSFTNYEEMFSPKKPRAHTTRGIITLLIAVAGLSLAVFGGYLVYTKTKSKKEPALIKNEEIQSPKSATEVTKTKDSIIQPVEKKVVSTTPIDSLKNMYRFVIETSPKARAIYRYNFLKANFIDVKMDTKDSILFKLYFLLPSLPTDTTKKKDSLQRLYGTRSRTTIELN